MNPVRWAIRWGVVEGYGLYWGGDDVGWVSKRHAYLLGNRLAAEEVIRGLPDIPCRPVRIAHRSTSARNE